jgi:hypothetical protein
MSRNIARFRARPFIELAQIDVPAHGKVDMRKIDEGIEDMERLDNERALVRSGQLIPLVLLRRQRG